ncbi:MAG TPA: hypothetical protein VK699_13965 [Terriglobales bacterium]|nr:hypothetical protein [Terriglobales bacterium]
MPSRSLAYRSGFAILSVMLALTSSVLAQVEVAKLRPNLVWQRASPATGATDGPVLYQLLLSGAGTPGTIAKFDTNPRHLINSHITDVGGIVAIGGMSVDSGTGIISFAGGQTFPGTGTSTITSITAGTGLSGGGNSGNVTLSNAGVLGIAAADSSVTVGGTAANPTLAVNSTTSDARYVLKAGDTMTGALNLPANGLVAGGSQLVLSGGKVGIGTGVPNAQLQVTGPGGGSAIGSGSLGGPGDAGLNAVGGSGGQTIGSGSIGGTGGSPSIAGGAGGPVIGSGAVGGTGGSSSIVGGAGGTAIGAGSANGNGGSVFIEPGSGAAFGNVLIADVGGNVGVGTASPGQKLDVAGNINASGSVSAASFTGSGTALGGIVLATDARLSDARAPLAGSSFYIQNQNASPQTANMSITGNAVVGGTATVNTSVLTPQLSANGTGSALTVNATSGAGNGGVLSLSAGDAGTSNGGAGGDLNIKAGNAAVVGGAGYSGLGPAGKVNITSGTGYNSVGGDVILKSGTNSNWSLSSAGTHSNVSLQGGGLLGADGAVLTVEGAGNGCSNNCNATFGGNVRITAGAGFGGDPGGSIILTPGSPSGNVQIAGNLSVTGSLSKGSGSFKIDHPLDPANKYLSHSFVESPDMMNVYNGNVVLDAKGQAWVELPDYFEALNQDFRYQLTPIGNPGQHILYIAQEIARNRFQIGGGNPGAKVSWQVTGIRHDAYANAHRIPVEEDKGNKRGTYLHPELFEKQQENTDAGAEVAGNQARH